MNLKPGNTFKYAGEVWISEGGNKISLSETTFYIEEYWPYEPAAYVHEDILIVSISGDNGEGELYDIPVAFVLDYYGICSDCGRKHGSDPLDCEFNRMVD